MKKAFTIVALLFFMTSVFGQKLLDISFGSTVEQVAEHVKSQPEASLRLSDYEMVIANTENYTVSYFFSKNKLYRVDLVKLFSDKEDALETADAHYNMFKGYGANFVRDVRNKKKLEVIALHSGFAQELVVVPLDHTLTEFRISKTSTEFCPDEIMAQILQGQLLYSMNK